MKRFLVSGMLAVAALSMVGCGSDASTDPVDTTVPSSELSQELKDSITYMYNEEGLAHDVYLAIYKIQPVNQLQNIANNSETKHIEAVNELAIKYDLNMTTYDPTIEPYSKEGIGDGNYSVHHIQVLYDALYPKGIKSKQDALEVGCMVEVVDIVDLEAYITLAKESNAPDVLAVFDFLIKGSYTHYWAFDDGLMKLKNSNDPNDGCCSVLDEFGLSLDFCHPEYPTK